jgi:glycosyltransferase involved in cell wall biosynthesis
MPHKQKKSNLKRTLLARSKGQKLYDPAVFLSPRRIDIAAKTIFARAYLEGNTSTWPEHVYKEHVRAFNDFVEKEPTKNGYEDFKNSFIRTIEGVKNDDSWKYKAPVLHNKTYLVNGAHRVAASMVVGDKVNVETPAEIYEDSYDHNYFRRDRSGIDGIDEDILDSMTIEYVSQKKKSIFVAIIFPAAEGFRREAYEHLSKLGEIVNMKTFPHDAFVGKEVVKQLYFNSKNDKWNYGLDFDSAKYKADLCFAGTGSLQVYVIEANLKESTRIKEKQYLRDLWKKDKHSIHITDTIDEANRLVRMFFNENSRRFMTIDRKQEFASQKMYDMFNEYMKLAPKDYVEREKVAIEGSAVFDLLNIREGRDIDYISRDDSINFKSENIEKHTAEDNNYHSESIDEITTNPKNFFYYKGYKFVDIFELQKYKRNRIIENNPKDLQDLKLIKDFIRRHPRYRQEDEALNIELPLVSVIIPVFNTSKKYLQKALDGVDKQNYPNIEVIIIDDGSDEETAGFLDTYVANRGWHLVHQKNKGLSAARNTGYSLAKGKYVQFLDSDDYTYRRLIEEAVSCAETTEADIVIENFTIRDYKTDSESVALDAAQFPTKATFKLTDISENRIGHIPCGVWSKLFRKDFLDKYSLKYDEKLLRAEDVPFTYSALVLAKKITLLPEFYITYRENIPKSNSETNDVQPMASVEAWRRFHDFLVVQGLYETYRNDFEFAMLESVSWHYERLKKTQSKTELSEAAVKFFKDIDVTTRNNHYLAVSLASIDHELTTIVEGKIESLENRSQELETLVERMNAELNHLRKPGVKLAVRKLAGAVRRKFKKTVSFRKNKN